MTEPNEPIAPSEVRAHATGLKLHLRRVEVGRYTYRIVTLRPTHTARFSTNYFHDTWHILTDREGAFTLARLLWGLAFQRAPGTAVLIDGVQLQPTPFEADPASPVLIIPAGLTRVDAGLLRQLKSRLRRPPPQSTIRWQTFSLPRAAAEPNDWRRWSFREGAHERSQEQMQRLGGFLCYTAPPEILRLQALAVYGLRDCSTMSYHYLAEAVGRGRHPDGEVQVFRDFRDMVSSATVARRSVLTSEGSTAPVSSTAPFGLDDKREAVYREAESALARLRTSRQLRQAPRRPL